MYYPTVGIPVDVKHIEINPYHVVGEKYINAIAHGSGCFPVLLPAMEKGEQLRSLSSKFDLTKQVKSLDGLFLPGSISNIHPSHYAEELQTPNLPTDRQRDATTLDLIKLVVDEGIPLLAICRGFQELNVAYGGSIHQKIQEVGTYMDHREDASQPRDEQYKPAHSIELTKTGKLYQIFKQEKAWVNSIHGQGINKLGDGLFIEARAPDKLIEAISVTNSKSFTLGVQWHAEWRFWDNPLSSAIFNAFGEAVKHRHRSQSLK